jgi:micrococcal nuclease
VDGDTIVLGTGEKVRLIGVDTPEVHESAKLCKHGERSQRDVQTIRGLGNKASEFTTKLVKGKHVRREFDQVNGHTNHKDRYGRTLAYVYLKDGTFFKRRDHPPGIRKRLHQVPVQVYGGVPTV